jgi:hypothetical protein
VIVKEPQFNFDMELGLEEGEKSDVVAVLGSELLQSVPTANPLQLEEICGVVSATRWRLSIPSTSFPTNESEARRCSNPVKRRLTKGAGRLSEKCRLRER